MAWLKKRKGSAYWEKMGLLHLAVEVLTGDQIAFNDSDIIENGKGEILVGDTEKIVEVYVNSDNQLQFSLHSSEEKGIWYIANFEKHGFVKVMNRYNPTQQNEKICVTGSSKNDRQEISIG